ncbi:MAG: hypothetical protein HEEMFOPI_00703 [Holosporales bacterium]
MFLEKVSKFLFIASIPSCLMAQDAMYVVRHDPYSCTISGYMRQIETMREQMRELSEGLEGQHSLSGEHDNNIRIAFSVINFLGQQHNSLREGLTENIKGVVDETLMLTLTEFKRNLESTISNIELKTQEDRSVLSAQSETLEALSANFNQTLRTVNQLRAEIRSNQKTLTDIQNAQKQKENPQLKEVLAELNRLRELVTQNNYKKEISALRNGIQKCQEEIATLRRKNKEYGDNFEQIESIFNSRIAELNHKFELQNREIEALRKENDDLKKKCATRFSALQLTVEDVESFKKIFQDMRDEEAAQKNKEAASLSEPLCAAPAPSAADEMQEKIEKQSSDTDEIPLQQEKAEEPKAVEMSECAPSAAMPEGEDITMSTKPIPHAIICATGAITETQIGSVIRLLGFTHPSDQAEVDDFTAQAITRKFSMGEAVSAGEYDLLKKIFTKELITYCFEFDQRSKEEQNVGLEKIATLCRLDCQMFKFTYVYILISCVSKQEPLELKNHLLCLIKNSIKSNLEILKNARAKKVSYPSKKDMRDSAKQFMESIDANLSYYLIFINFLNKENLEFFKESFQEIADFYQEDPRSKEGETLMSFDYLMNYISLNIIMCTYKSNETEETSKDYNAIAQFLKKISAQACTKLILIVLKKENQPCELDIRVMKHVYRYYNYFYRKKKEVTPFYSYLKESLLPVFDDKEILKERKQWFLKNIVEPEDAGKNGFKDFKREVLKHI